MKILLAGFAKIKYMPYANFYLDNIDQKRHDVHLVYWNRDLQPEDTSKYADVTLHEFRYYQEDNVSRSSKISGFLQYRQYVKRLLKQERFDFVIALHSMPAILLQDVWTGKYRDRFIFDYRDSTYERYPVYKKMIGNLIKHAKATFTSSDGFRVNFPPEYAHKVYTTHNILEDSLYHRYLLRESSERIRISFWGLVREEQTEKAMIEKISADPRFELHYYGREQATAKKLKAYAQQIGADNVFFHGEYTPPERYDFAAKTDLIHNIYCNANMMLAMSNKYYDGSLFYIPQLCTAGSFMAEAAESSGIGLACDPWSENFTDTVYNYYMSLDKTAFASACDQETDRIVAQYRAAVKVIADCLGGGVQ